MKASRSERIEKCKNRMKVMERGYILMLINLILMFTVLILLMGCGDEGQPLKEPIVEAVVIPAHIPQLDPKPGEIADYEYGSDDYDIVNDFLDQWFEYWLGRNVKEFIAVYPNYRLIKNNLTGYDPIKKVDIGYDCYYVTFPYKDGKSNIEVVVDANGIIFEVSSIGWAADNPYVPPGNILE